MSPNKSRLGRGLEGLISGGVKPPPSAESKSPPAAAGKAGEAAITPPAGAGMGRVGEGFVEIPTAKIEPNPYQPRREIHPEQVRELAESIRSVGLLQPILVRKVEDRYQLLAGERRWRACQFLQMARIPARLMESSDAASALISMIENLQRESLNPIEEAAGFASLIRDFDMTQESVSERVGKNRSTVANALRLLQLDKEVQGYLAKGHISVGHAKALLGLEESEQRLQLARRIIEKELSVRDTERLANALKTARKTGDGRGKPAAASEQRTLQDLERRLSSRLNTPVAIHHSAKKGRLVIEYFGNEDLQRLLERLGLG